MNDQEMNEKNSIPNTLNFARIVTDAYFGAYEIDKLTDQTPLTLPQAYAIQDQALKILADRGDRRIGYKMGLTSKAKMKQMGVHQPIYGVLTEKMRVASGSTFSLRGRIHPKIEPEIAFLIGRDLEGKVSPEEAMSACSGVCAAMEIIDSRYRNFNFTLPDVIADNCSSSAFVLGETIRKPAEIDLGNLGMLMEINGKPVQFGSSSAIYGHPAASLAELCAMLSEQGQRLRAGDIVLAGAATAALSLEPGQEIQTSVQDLGSVRLIVS
jgi:2-oxo-3-hexenedioate decarboxylase